MSTDPLLMLAAADPARTLQPASTEELDARRAEIPTPELQRTRRRVRRRAVVIVLAAVALVASGAIAGGFQPWARDPGRQTGPKDADRVFQSEYHAAQAKLTLPPGSDWPSRSVPANSIIPTGRGGMGESTAVLLAIDAWSCFAVDEHAAGRETASRAAARTVVSLVREHVVTVPAGTPEDGSAPRSIEGPVAQVADDGGRESILHAASAAIRGSITGLASYCRANGPSR